MKKKILATILAAATAVSTIACSAPSSQKTSDPETTGAPQTMEEGDADKEPVTIHYFGHANSNGANEQIIADFQKEYPWITVELVDLPNDTAQKLSTISTILQAKDPSIDVMVIDGTWTQYKGYKFRYLEPEEQIEAENYISFSNKNKKVKLSQLTF